MSYIKTKGIVIKSVISGDDDKIITILTSDLGKIQCFIKGAKKPKSRYNATIQFLCFSNFVLFKGKDMYLLNTSDIIESFYEYRNDIVKLTYASYFSDIINDVVYEGQQSHDILRLFLNTLYILEKSDRSPSLISRIFELRLLSVIGFAPFVSGCILCSKTSFLKKIFFSFSKCGFICLECSLTSNKDCVELSFGAAKTINHIILSDMNYLFKIDLSDRVLYELEKISIRYLEERLEKKYFQKINYLQKIALF